MVRKLAIFLLVAMAANSPADEEGFRLLGDPAFTARSRGSEIIAKWAGEDWEEAKPIILEHYLGNPDPEIRHRLRAILYENHMIGPPAYLGITFTMETRINEAGKEIPVASVLSVANGGSAEKAGIKRGDQITTLGNHQVHRKADLIKAVKALNSGNKVKITLYRTGKPITVQIKLLPKPNAEKLTERQREEKFSAWLNEKEKIFKKSP